MEVTVTRSNLSRTVTVTALAGVLVAGLVSLASAQPPSDGGFRGPRGGLMMGLRDLDLSDAQRDQIRELVQTHREANRATAEQLRAARVALNEAVMAEVVNESEIRALSAQVAPLEADSAVQRAYFNAQLLQVLTPDQRGELQDIQAEMEDRRSRRRQGSRGVR